MPIASGARGRPGVLGHALGPRVSGNRGASVALVVGRRQYRLVPLSPASVFIAGVTKDGTGAALGGCTVQLFRTWNDEYLGETMSDGAGNYSILAPGSSPFYLVAYKVGAPDVAGTTVNTLEPA